MPTGTTCFIENDPNATFRQFALRCSRLFIYDSPMGNEPLPRREVQPYYVDELKKSRARLAELETMTVAQADVIAASEFVAAMKRHEESNREHEEKGKRYKRLRAEVEAWVPPTPLHESGIKRVMLEQIDVSWYERDPDLYKPVLLLGADWLEKELKRQRANVATDEVHLADEEKRCADMNLWLEQLEKSLPPAPHELHMATIPMRWLKACGGKVKPMPPGWPTCDVHFYLEPDGGCSCWPKKKECPTCDCDGPFGACACRD